MKAWQDCLNIKKLADLCKKKDSELDTILRLLPQFGDDIKQVRFDTKTQQLIICVEPWVWANEVREAVENHRAAIETAWGVSIHTVKVKFLLS